MIELIDFHDDAALLTICYARHALRPYIDSEINNTFRHYIRISLVNLPSTFKDKSVISSVPIYVENKESPIICSK